MPTLIRRSARERTAGFSVEPSVRRKTIMTPLTAFAVHPEAVRFETQEDEEEVLLFLRQHSVVLVPGVLLMVFLALTPVVVVPIMLRFLSLPFEIAPKYLVVATAFWYVMTFGVSIMNFLRWYYNIYIVTNRRIVDIDFIHLLYKEFSEARLDKIQIGRAHV